MKILFNQNISFRIIHKIFFIILTITTFSSCAQNKNKESFEGIITYKISFISKTDDIQYFEYQKQKYGDKLKISILKNGSYKKEYPSSGDKGYDFINYNSLSNTSYAKWKNIDTTFAFDCSENSLILKEEKILPSEIINNQICDGYYISGVDKFWNQEISLKYYYPKNKEYLNPDFYNECKDGFYDRISKKMKSPFYKLIMDMEKFTVIFEVEKIEKRIIDEDIIEISKDIPLKKT